MLTCALGPTTYLMSLSLSKLDLQFIFINGEDLYPCYMMRDTTRCTFMHHRRDDCCFRSSPTPPHYKHTLLSLFTSKTPKSMIFW